MNLKRRIAGVMAAGVLAATFGLATAGDAHAYAGWEHCKTGDNDGNVANQQKTLCVWWEVDTSGGWIRPRKIQVTNVHTGGADEMLGNDLTEYVNAGLNHQADIDSLGTLYNGTLTIDAYFDCGSNCAQTRQWISRNNRPTVNNYFGRYWNGQRYGTTVWATQTVAG